MSLRVKTRILLFLDFWGVGNLNPYCDNQTHHSIPKLGWEQIKTPTVTFWSKELMKGVMQNFWEKKKGHIFLIFVIFHIRKVPCLLKPSLWTSASSYLNSVFVFVFFRQCKRHWDTLSLLILVIMCNESCFFGDLNQVFCNRILAPTVGAKDGTLTLRAVTLVHPKRFFGNKSLRVQDTLKNTLRLIKLSTGGEGGCTVGQVTSRTMRNRSRKQSPLAGSCTNRSRWNQLILCPFGASVWC